MHVFIYVRPNVTRNVCTCQTATWKALLDPKNADKPVLATNISGSGERGDDKSRPAQAAVGRLLHPLVILCIEIRAIDSALASSLQNPCKSDRTSLLEVWDKTIANGVDHLNATGRPCDPTWTTHRFSQAIVSEFGVCWSARDRKHVEYVKYCERHSIVPQQQEPRKKPVAQRSKVHFCAGEGCSNESLVRKKGSLCKSCLPLWVKPTSIISESKDKAHKNDSDKWMLNGYISSATGQGGMYKPPVTAYLFLVLYSHFLLSCFYTFDL